MIQKDLNAKEGMRIRIISMADDPNPVPPGTEGTIILVDEEGVIYVKWDDGRTLGVIPGFDSYELLDSNKIFENNSNVNAIKKAINNIHTNVDKSMPKSKNVSSSINTKMKSSGIETGQVTKNFKSAKIKDVKVEQDNKIENKADKIKNLPINNLNSKKNKSIKTETTMAAGGQSTGAYTGQAWGSDPFTKSNKIIKSKLTKTKNKNIKTSYSNTILNKEDINNIIKNKLEEYKIINDKKINKIEEEDLNETTTFDSVWGDNTKNVVGQAFVFKNGQWKLVKKPIWKGGLIVKKDKNDGVLTHIDEINKVKYNPKGKYVKISKKCTKFPYCNQGSIDNPLNISNKFSGSGMYVEELDDETINNIHEVSKEIGKPFIEVYRIVINELNK